MDFERNATLMLHTLSLVAAVAAMAIPIGTGLAWLVFRTDLAYRRSLLLGLFVQALTPLVLQAGAWQAGFGLAGWWTLQHGGTVWLDGWRGAIWIHSLAAIPTVTLVIGFGLQQVDVDLESTARITLTPWQLWRRVTLPRSLSTLVVALLWIAISVGGEMTVTDFFQVRTFAEELYTEAAVGEIETLSWSAWPLAAVSSVFALWGTWWLDRWMPLRREREACCRTRTDLSLRQRALAKLFVIAVLGVLILIPMLSLAWKAGVMVISSDQGRIRSWSLLKCATVVVSSPWRYRQEIGVSALLASTTAFLSTAIAWPVARHLRWKRRSGRPLFVLCALLASTPGPIVGLALITLVNQPSVPGLTWLYDRTLLAPLLAHLWRALPWSCLIAWSACRTVPDELVDRAQLAGWRTLASLRWIVLPGQRGLFTMSLALPFFISWGDVAGSILVMPPGDTPLSIRVFGLLHYGVEDEVAGICLAQTLLGGLLGTWVFCHASRSSSDAVS